MINTGRFLLRDWQRGDRAAFIAYQCDPRYRAMYDLPDDAKAAKALFDDFLKWQGHEPRRNWQFGIFERSTGRLLGTAGLRGDGLEPGEAMFGIELIPDQWGRYRLALDVSRALVDWGFAVLRLKRILGETASGNLRVEKIATSFGARPLLKRDGPDWMRARGWRATVWALDRGDPRWSKYNRAAQEE